MTDELQIPKTVVEKVEPDNPSYGEVPGTAAHDMRRADAEPDEIVTAPDTTRAKLEGQSPSRALSGSPTALRSRSLLPERHHMMRTDTPPAPLQVTEPQQTDLGRQSQQSPDHLPDLDLAELSEQGGFAEDSRVSASGDDFDDFEEGGGEDDDFGSFDDQAASPVRLQSTSSDPASDPVNTFSAQDVLVSTMCTKPIALMHRLLIAACSNLSTLTVPKTWSIYFSRL